MGTNPTLPPALLQNIPWNREVESIWIGSTLSLKRNLSRYYFPSKLPSTEISQVLQTIKNRFAENEAVKNASYFQFNDLSPTDRELIFEHFLFLKGLDQPLNGSALLLNEEATLLALVNTKNHLELYAISTTPQWENSWTTLNQIEGQLGSKEGFAFSPKFGYLTSDPGDCGTGLNVQVFLHLPALVHTHQLDSALANGREEELQFLSLSGNLDQLIGDVIVVQNRYSIGMSEEAILKSVQRGATKLMGAEKTMRQHLKASLNNEVKNKISKAYGLLVHSYQLETKEALDLISLMLLGLSLGYIVNVTEQKLTKLFYQCRRGYFSHLFTEITDPQMFIQKRAEFLQKELYGIALKDEVH